MRQKENEHRERERNERRARRWSELAQQTQRALNEDDWQGASQAYFGQAALLFAEGKEHCHAASEAHKFELMRMREAGIKKVKISTAQDERVCPGCRALEGKVFTVNAAMKNRYLPGQQCDDGNSINPHGGRCRCIYMAVL